VVKVASVDLVELLEASERERHLNFSGGPRKVLPYRWANPAE